MTKGIHIMNPKKQKQDMSPYFFYSIITMHSYRKPELQKDLPNITQSK